MNKTQLALILSTIALASGLFKLMSKDSVKNNTENMLTFMKWTQVHQKKYQTPKEYLYRLGVFLKNLEFIKKHNNSKLGFTMGLNKFADLTKKEFMTKYTGFIPSTARNDLKESPLFRKTYPLGQAPESIDWEAKGAVTRVKNQGACGSCWAFSAIGAIESVNKINGKELTEFSEQQLVDCSTSYGNQGCNGGLMRPSFQYVIDHGLATEQSYPYKARDRKCKSDFEVSFKLKKYGTVPKNDNDALKNAVAGQPVAVAIDATVLQFYFGGIIGRICGHSLNHGVLAVGYGHEHNKDYWLVKNSWGKGWGIHGYFKVLRDSGVKPSPCGIAMQASYPIKE